MTAWGGIPRASRGINAPWRLHYWPFPGRRPLRSPPSRTLPGASRRVSQWHRRRRRRDRAPAGRIPRKKPITVPRTMDQADCAQSSSGGSSPFTFVVKTSCLMVSSMFSRTSEIPKSPMTTGTSPTPSSSLRDIEGEPGQPGDVVQAHGPEIKAEGGHHQGPDHGSRGQEGQDLSPRTIRREVFRRAEFEGEVTSGGRNQHQADDADRSGDEGAEGRNPQGRAGPAVAGHLVAVEAGHHRGGFARDVHQDRRGGAAVLAP